MCAELVCQHLGITPCIGKGIEVMLKWYKLAELVESVTDNVRIAVVGKYTHLKDAYVCPATAIITLRNLLLLLLNMHAMLIQRNHRLSGSRQKI